jgi:putative membrane protein
MLKSLHAPTEQLSRFDLLMRGLVAGACGGVAGAGVKLLGEAIFPPRFPGEPIPPAVAVSKALEFMSGAPLLPERMTLAVQTFHWSFSIGAAAVYGVVVEIFPKAKIGYGIGFGLVLLLLTHETTLPLLGLSLPWSQIPLKEHLSEIFTHSLFGVAVELVRRVVRSFLSRLGDLFPARMEAAP